MNICGVLVHAVPARAVSVVDELKSLAGVEVHQTGSGGRIVLTVEDTDEQPAIDTLRDIHRLDGIVAASLIYHHFEPAHAAAEQNAL